METDAGLGGLSPTVFQRQIYALSHCDDVAAARHDWQTYRSGRGTTANIPFSGIEVPPGILLFEDPPLRDLHRRLLSRVFTPRRMLAVEG
ncbi:Cytochrome P450 130 [Mycobacterium attenuatum]|nr:Cytochrome P450 130 [Mycobacterium attenuatum]